MPNIYFKGGGGEYIYHASKHIDGGDDEITQPLDLSAIPDTLTNKSADKVDNYHAGNEDGKVLVLPTATQGQVIVRNANNWVAGAPSGISLLRVSRITSDQTMTASQWNKIQFNNVNWDTLNGWSGAIYKYTFSNAGKYLIIVSLRFNYSYSSPLYHDIGFYKNGSIHKQIRCVTYGASGINETNLTGVDIIDVNANDYLEIYLFAGCATPVKAGDDRTYLNIIKV